MDARISARAGQVVALDTIFYGNGEPFDPYAIREVNIYRDQVQAENLIATIPVVNPEDDDYPSPLVKTDTGKYYLPFLMPADAVVPSVYLDIWTYYPTNPCGGEAGTGGTGGGEIGGTTGGFGSFPQLMLAEQSNNSAAMLPRLILAVLSVALIQFRSVVLYLLEISESLS